jgi:hypothetical protein
LTARDAKMDDDVFRDIAGRLRIRKVVELGRLAVDLTNP